MKVLIVGGDGRAHVLAWCCGKSPDVNVVYVAPGNPGTEQERKTVNVPIAVTDIPGLLRFAQDNAIDLTVVSPEGPLVAGIVDTFQAAGLRIFGPTQAAAQLESSKAWAKNFMARYGIPTAPYRTFTDAAAARAYVTSHGAPIVIKADGLAAGKGVVVAMTVEEAHVAIDLLMVQGAHGGAGRTIVIEDFLPGEEASFMVMVDIDGCVLPLATSQDHKRLLAGDQGPNTGGMGAYSPAPVVTSTVHRRVMDEIVHPTVQGMIYENTPFVGFLYVGLMIDADGNPRVVEFNCRLGDPEAQPILMRLKSDLVGLMGLALDGGLGQAQVDWDPRPALGVVLAAQGYPDSPRKGDAIAIPEELPADCQVFHAGTTWSDGRLVTNGGRVLCVTALGETLFTARVWAYLVAQETSFAGMQYRPDIGHRAIAPSS